MKTFKIDGVYCRLIPLTKGMYSIVSEADFDWLNQWKWTARSNSWGSFYASRGQRIPGTNKIIRIQMHRLILGLEQGDPIQADHRNGVTLDNRRENLRRATNAQNRRNSRKNKENQCGFKGVYLYKGRYRAHITIDGKKISLGWRSTAREAYEELYVPAAIKNFGEFARLS